MLKDLNVLIDEESLNKRISEIADEISKDFPGEDLVFICVLKGASFFAIDLSKKIKNNEVILDFVKISSYGIGARKTTGKINFTLDISQNIENKNVIIIEDIVDSGRSLSYLSNYFKAKNPKTLKICVLLDKYSRRETDVILDYVGFQIDDKFVLGYGLDYDEKYRNLPFIGYIDDNSFKK